MSRFRTRLAGTIICAFLTTLGGTGHVESVENGHATSEGNNPQPAHWRTVQSGELSDQLDNPLFNYYVQITLRRTTPTPKLVVQGVRLNAN